MVVWVAYWVVVTVVGGCPSMFFSLCSAPANSPIKTLVRSRRIRQTTKRILDRKESGSLVAAMNDAKNPSCSDDDDG